jgi:hypothetical protein
MTFVQKLPCQVARVLDSADYPPHDVPHTTCQYPLYYDALYYPHYHPLVFRDENTVYEWLLKGLENHTMTCVSCLHDHPHSASRTYGVEYMVPSRFSVATSSAEVIISVNSIESAAFTFCRLIRHLLSGSMPTDNWLESAQYVLCKQPSWLFRSEEHYLQALTELSVPVLVEASHALGLTGRLRKAELIRVILHDFARERLSFLDSDVTPDEPPHHFAIVIARHFDC